METDNSVLTDEQLAKFQEIAKKRRDSRAGIISEYLENQIIILTLVNLSKAYLTPLYPHLTYPVIFISTCTISYMVFWSFNALF